MAFVAASAQCQTPAEAAAPQLHPLVLNLTRYRVQAGESVGLDAPSETIDFLVHASSRHVEIDGKEAHGIVIAPNRAGNQVLVAASLRMKPGDYAVTLSAVTGAGETRNASLSVLVDALPPVPSSPARPPVVLLNGWQISFSSSCPVSPTGSVETFGPLQQDLLTGINGPSYSVPAVYFFDNCKECPSCQIQDLGSALAQFLNMIQYNLSYAPWRARV